MCSCHSILECCVTFSGVKLSIRSFVLFHSAILKNSVRPMHEDQMMPTEERVICVDGKL